MTPRRHRYNRGEALSPAERHGKTIITIAHRLATIDQADQILVVEDERPAEPRGSPSVYWAASAPREHKMLSARGVIVSEHMDEYDKWCEILKTHL